MDEDYSPALLQTLTCVLEVVLCKANPGLVPFQAGRVKVALAVELLKKKLSCLGNNTPETPPEMQEFYGLHWNSVLCTAWALASNMESSWHSNK